MVSRLESLAARTITDHLCDNAIAFDDFLWAQRRKRIHLDWNSVSSVFDAYHKQTLQRICIAKVVALIDENWSVGQSLDIDQCINILTVPKIVKDLLLEYKEAKYDIEFEQLMDEMEQAKYVFLFLKVNTVLSLSHTKLYSKCFVILSFAVSV